jgi:hypothetical protein
VSEGVATDQFFGNGRVPQMVQVLVVAVEDDRDTISAAREVLGVEWLMDITFSPVSCCGFPSCLRGRVEVLPKKCTTHRKLSPRSFHSNSASTTRSVWFLIALTIQPCSGQSRFTSTPHLCGGESFASIQCHGAEKRPSFVCA